VIKKLSKLELEETTARERNLFFQYLTPDKVEAVQNVVAPDISGATTEIWG
jgi:hypothetical protein